MGDKGLGLLIGFGKPKSSDEDEGDSDSRGMACKAMLKALKSSDSEAFGEALDLFLDARKPKSDKDEGDSESDEYSDD